MFSTGVWKKVQLLVALDLIGLELLVYRSAPASTEEHQSARQLEPEEWPLCKSNTQKIAKLNFLFSEKCDWLLNGNATLRKEGLCCVAAGVCSGTEACGKANQKGTIWLYELCFVFMLI